MSIDRITQADLDGTSARGRAAYEHRLRELHRMGIELTAAQRARIGLDDDWPDYDHPDTPFTDAAEREDARNAEIDAARFAEAEAKADDRRRAQAEAARIEAVFKKAGRQHPGNGCRAH